MFVCRYVSTSLGSWARWPECFIFVLADNTPRPTTTSEIRKHPEPESELPHNALDWALHIGSPNRNRPNSLSKSASKAIRSAGGSGVPCLIGTLWVSEPQSHFPACPPRISGMRSRGSTTAADCTGGLAIWASSCFRFCSNAFRVSGGIGQNPYPHSGRIFPQSGRIFPQTGAFLKSARSIRALLEHSRAFLLWTPGNGNRLASVAV